MRDFVGDVWLFFARNIHRALSGKASTWGLEAHGAGLQLKESPHVLT